MYRIIFILNYNPHKNYYLFNGKSLCLYLIKFSSELITQNGFKLKLVQN